MFGVKPGVRAWWIGPVTGLARILATWAAVTYVLERIRGQVKDIGEETRSEAQRVAREARQLFRSTEKSGVSDLRQEVLKKAPVSVQRIIEQSGEDFMEKKKSWSLFKVILVLGMIIAVAVFLLDRLLPKPYRDEELEDDWTPAKADEKPTGDTARPMAAEGVAEAVEDEEIADTSGGNGKLDDSEKKSTTRKRNVRKDSDS